MVLLLFMVISSMSACAALQASWNKATPTQKCQIIISDIQQTLTLTVTTGAIFVDANPKYRADWKAKILPAVLQVNTILDGFIVELNAGATTITYTDIINAVQANMTNIKTILNSWGVKVEGGRTWHLS
jgi:uncharacterized membrane protein YjdF